MQKNYFEKQAAKKRRMLATIRYILPFAFTVILFILFSLPLIYFKDYNNNLTEKSSLFTRIFDNIDQARNVLFSQTAANNVSHETFYSFILTGAVIALICFVIGIVSAFTYMLAGLSFLSHRDGKATPFKRIFISLIPCEAVVIVLCALSVVPAFFPHFLVKALDRIMMVYSKVLFVAKDLIWWCIALLLFLIFYFVLTKKYDTSDVNIFVMHPKKEEYEENDDDTFDEDDDVPLTAEEKTRKEQTEAIIKLLNKDKK